MTIVAPTFTRRKSTGNLTGQNNVLPLVRLQRSLGEIKVSFKRREKRTVLEAIHQSGCCKARFPVPEPGAWPEAVLLNTAGGLTDGDRISIEARWQPHAKAIITTQAAERIYCSRGGSSHIRNRLSVGAQATALWLPQETIFFDGGQFERSFVADIAEGGRLLACESTVFGRSAMGETVRSGFLFDKWRVRYAKKLVFADALRLEGDILDRLKRPALMRGANAIASIVLVDDRAENRVEQIRSILKTTRSVSGCSTIGPVLVIRLLAGSGAELRRDLIHVLQETMRLLQQEVRQKRCTTLPRVWSC